METLSRLMGIYMTMGRISRRRDFTRVPFRGSVFVYMITYLTRVNPSAEAVKTCRVSHHKMSCRCETHRGEFTPVVVWEREFHSGTKFVTLSWKIETNSRFGLTSTWRWPGTGCTCVVLVNSCWSRDEEKTFQDVNVIWNQELAPNFSSFGQENINNNYLRVPLCVQLLSRKLTTRGYIHKYFHSLFATIF